MFPSVETAGVEPASLDVTNSQSLQLPCQMTASLKNVFENYTNCKQYTKQYTTVMTSPVKHYQHLSYPGD